MLLLVYLPTTKWSLELATACEIRKGIRFKDLIPLLLLNHLFKCIFGKKWIFCFLYDFGI